MTKTTRRPGRPKKGTEAKNVTIGVRVTDEQALLFEEAAGSTPVSRWLRDVGLSAAEKAKDSKG